MKVLIRTDASVLAGSGHVMRCLTLAEKLRAQGGQVTFLCRTLAGNLHEHIRKQGFELITLPWDESETRGIDPDDLYANWLAVPMRTEITQTIKALKSIQPVDWIIVDHYALDREWEAAVRPLANSIMVIDDLANRKHDCDILLDQNLFADAGSRYEGLVGEAVHQLLGPEYALLRDEFSLSRRSEAIDRSPGHWLISYGGADPTNETSKALKAIDLLGDRATGCDVIVGNSNPFADEVKGECARRAKVEFHQGVSNIAEIMSHSELALGAPGSSTWERCCLGLPSLLTSIAANQIPIGQNLEQAGCGLYLGESDRVTPELIAEQGAVLMAQSKTREQMRERGMALVDGLGTGRVCEQLMIAHGAELSQPEVTA